MFGDGPSLALALAQAVAADLRGAIARRGKARLAVSGGSTPRAFLTELSKQALDWAHVTVVPVDDRWVAPDHPRSNERLLRETLLRGEAAQAQLLPLRRPAPTPESALLPVLTQVANEALPLDVVVLGMGEDGHIGGLFTGHPALDELTRVAAVHDAPRPPFRRLTLSLSFLISTAEIWVVAVGERKRTLVQAAVRRNFSNTPLDLLLRHAPQVTIYTDQVVLRR